MLRAGIVLLVGVALAAAGGAAARPEAASPAQTVRSADGLLTVSVPAGALARHVRVSAALVPQQRLPPELRRLRGAPRVYELRPAGLRFAKPVTVTRRIPRADLSKGVPVAVLALRGAGGAWSWPAAQRVRASGNDVLVSGRIRHFSELAAFGGLGTVDIEPRKVSRAVGKGFDAQVVATGRLEIDAFVSPFGGEGIVRVSDRSSFSATRCCANLTFECARVGLGRYGARVPLRPPEDARGGDSPAAHLGVLLDLRGAPELEVEVAGVARCTRGAAPPRPRPQPQPASPLRAACVAVTHAALAGFPSFLTWRFRLDGVPAGARVELTVGGANDDRPATTRAAAGRPTELRTGIRSYGEKRIRRFAVDGRDLTQALVRLVGPGANVTAAEGAIGGGCP